MNKFICSCLILGCFLSAFSYKVSAQGDFKAFIQAATEKRFISDSYKEKHLSAVSKAEWIQEHDFQSLYFYAQGVSRLHGDIYVELSVSPPDAICGGSLIVRFNQEGDLMEHELIEVNCQQDEDSEFFLSSEYEFVNDSTIEIQYKRWENVDLAFRNEQTGYSYLVLGKERMISVQENSERRELPMDVLLEDTLSEDNFSEDSLLEKNVQRIPGQDEFLLSHEVLQEDDLSGKTQSELRIMRNSIFARHGYSFRSKDLSEHFAAQPWYEKSEKNQEQILKELNEVEKANIQIIRRAEKNLTENPN